MRYRLTGFVVAVTAALLTAPPAATADTTQGTGSNQGTFGVASTTGVVEYSADAPGQVRSVTSTCRFAVTSSDESQTTFRIDGDSLSTGPAWMDQGTYVECELRDYWGATVAYVVDARAGAHTAVSDEVVVPAGTYTMCAFGTVYYGYGPTVTAPWYCVTP